MKETRVYAVDVRVDLSKAITWAPLVEAASEDEAKQKIQRWLDEQAPRAKSISWREAEIDLELDGSVRFDVLGAHLPTAGEEALAKEITDRAGPVQH